MKYFSIIMILWTCALSQYSDPWADSVVSFFPGTGVPFGREPEFFPANILGMPDTNTSLYVPSSNPNEICGLGTDGEIILEFKDNIIINGPGKDFTVFENPFFSLGSGKLFIEPAKIAISKDGLNYIEFPYDTLTFAGCAGLTPTNGKANFLYPDSSGGDSFDIGILGIDTVRFIRITDISKILKNPQHPKYDFMVNGFDLDAVVAVNSIPKTTSVEYNKPGKSINEINIHKDYISSDNYYNFSINTPPYSVIKIRIYDVLGKQISVYTETGNSNGIINGKIYFNAFPSGVYFINFISNSSFATRKVRILK